MARSPLHLAARLPEDQTIAAASREMTLKSCVPRIASQQMTPTAIRDSGMSPKAKTSIATFKLRVLPAKGKITNHWNSRVRPPSDCISLVCGVCAERKPRASQRRRPTTRGFSSKPDLDSLCTACNPQNDHHSTASCTHLGGVCSCGLRPVANATPSRQLGISRNDCASPLVRSVGFLPGA